MANKITEFTEDVEVIQKLGDYPNTDDGMSADELKAQFDKAPSAIKGFLNEQVVPAVQDLQDGIAQVDKTLTRDGYFADAKATGEAIAAAKAEATQQMQQAAQEAQAAADAAIAEADTATIAAAKAQAAAEQAASAYDSANNAKDHVNGVSATIDSLKDQIDSAVSQAAENAVIAQAAADAAIAEADTATIAAAKAQAAAETLETDTTLSVAGVAADAKATGNRIAEVQENLDNANGDIGLLDCSLGIVETNVQTLQQGLNETEQSVQALQNGQIVCSASGEVVTVHDASDHALKGLNLYGKTKQFTTTGKNIFPAPDVSLTGWGLTWECTDGLWHVYGTTNNVYPRCYMPTSLTLGAGTYCATPTFIQGSLSDVEKRVALCDTASTVYLANTTTLTETVDFSMIIFGNVPVGTTIDVKFYLMVNVGDVATAYEPYTGGMPSPNPDYPQELESVGDGGSVGVNVCGKNLIPYPYFQQSSAMNGGTFTVNADGGITAEGTPTDASVIILVNKEPIWSDNIRYIGLTGTFTNARIYCDLYDSSGAIITQIQTNTVIAIDLSLYPTATNYRIGVKRTENNVAMSGICYPMLCVGDNVCYEPYVSGGTLTAQTPNGLPGIPVSSGGNYTDANGRQWISDEVDFARGVYVQRINSVKAGNLAWSINSSWTNSNGTAVIAYTKIAALKDGAVLSNALHMREFTAKPTAWNAGEMATEKDGVLYVAISNAVEAASNAVAQYMDEHDIEIVYQLIEPIETPLSAEEIAAFKALHTNKPNTTVYTDSNAGIKLDYVADTKTYIDNKFAELAAAIVSNT